MISKIIRPTQLAKNLGISIATLYRMEDRGELPPRVQISRRAVGWLESDINVWLQERKQEPEIVEA